MSRSKARLLIIFISLLVVLAALLAGPFFWEHLRYTFNPPNTEHLQDAVRTYEPDTLSIESLGIRAPIVYVEEANEQVFQKALASGVVHYPGTAKPGNPGNTYLFGHSSDFPWSRGKYKTVFALLPRIALGAEVIVTDRAGNAFVYHVTESFVSSADNLTLLENTPGQYKLTLQTSYPIGTALRRWIVIAEFAGI